MGATKIFCKRGSQFSRGTKHLHTYCTVLAVLVGSQTKPLNLSHYFIADYTRRYYSRSITVLSRLIYNLKYRPVDVLSSALIDLSALTECSSRRLAANSLCLPSLEASE
jgi:hypothetical protein